MPGEMLPITCDNIVYSEVYAAARKMKNEKASGVDDLPAEFGKVLLEDEHHPMCSWIIEFCNYVWHNRGIPAEWHLSRVVALFKKGDMGDCSNYRPILLLSAGYKLFVIVTLGRLRAGVAEDRIWNS